MLQKTLRLSVIFLTLAAFTAQPALARQEPPPPAEEPQSTSSDPDEATAEAQSAQPPAPGALQPSGQTPAVGAAIPDGAAFESRIRASADAAEGLQGPLDGGWTVRGEGGEAIFGLQLVDKNSGELEGAWRDMRRVGAVGARGLVASMVREGDELTLRFYPVQGGDAVVLTVHSFGDNIWSGSLSQNGAETPVSLVRNTARPTGDYSGVPRGPVLPPGWVARVHRPAPAVSRHDDDGGRTCKTVGRGKKKRTVCSGGGSGKGRGGKERGGKAGRHKGGDGGSDKGHKHGAGKAKGGSGKSSSGKSGGKKKKR